jgi:hypothetical protein
MPLGVMPLHSPTNPDLERLSAEVRIIHCGDAEWRPWAREVFVRRKSDTSRYGRELIAYSVNSAGRIIRAWYLTEVDQIEFDQILKSKCNKPVDNCPIQAAWLATIAPGVESEPAWAYLRPAAHRSGLQPSAA